ncbi:MAG: phospholipase [Chloroflexi bacterium]|nr:MAG: phospholipase [Chloroflexota bacterium]
MSRRRTSKSRTSTSHIDNRRLLIIGLVVFLLLIYYLATGSDPLGLFEPEEGTPQTAVTQTAPAQPTLMVGQGGEWWSVYFTEPVGRATGDDLTGTVGEALIQRIHDAQTSIRIVAFEFNLTPIAEALIDAHQRGVTVQWVTDNEYGLTADQQEGRGQFALLQEAGIEVRADTRSALMHNKFWIFDEQTVWTGSMNATLNDIFRNNNNVLVIESPAVAAIYEREFAEKWEGQFGPTSPSTADRQATTLDGSSVQVYFAPEDRVMGQLIPLVDSAQTSVRFMAFSFTQAGLGDAMIERAQAGVDVQGIFETRGSETAASELPHLFCAGLPVRQDGNPGTFHHKVIVIDDAIVVTGSLNFSENADRSNDENVLVVSNQDIARLYLEEFDRRWAETTALAADKFDCSQVSR